MLCTLSVLAALRTSRAIGRCRRWWTTTGSGSVSRILILRSRSIGGGASRLALLWRSRSGLLRLWGLPCLPSSPGKFGCVFHERPPSIEECATNGNGHLTPQKRSVAHFHKRNGDRASVQCRHVVNRALRRRGYGLYNHSVSVSNRLPYLSCGRGAMSLSAMEIK